MRLFFKTYGDGEPLLILHGLFGSQENWHTIATRLGAEFRVFTIDQRNHGKSPHSFEMSYAAMAQDLVEFMAQEGLGTAMVLGHSMGGKTAMKLALLEPERVTKLLIVDIAPKSYPRRHDHVIKALCSLDLHAFQTRQQMENELAPAIEELDLRRFLLKNVVRTEAGGFKWRIGLPELASNYVHLSEALSSDRPWDKPVLFMRGANSDYIGEEDLPEIRRLFPRAQLETIPAAGHLVHVENAPVFLRRTLDFLNAAE